MERLNAAPYTCFTLIERGGKDKAKNAINLINLINLNIL